MSRCAGGARHVSNPTPNPTLTPTLSLTPTPNSNPAPNPTPNPNQVLDKCHQLVDLQHDVQYRASRFADPKDAYPNYEQLTHLKGAAVRSRGRE